MDRQRGRRLNDSAAKLVPDALIKKKAPYNPDDRQRAQKEVCSSLPVFAQDNFLEAAGSF